ncbi:MAG TPA: hypothetical protein VJ949_09770 [Cryomorphaceae bacterium]|nr:hypothetical protein [Cryomorphaceae bacterium]
MKTRLFPVLIALFSLSLWSCNDGAVTDESITNAEVSSEKSKEVSDETTTKVKDILHSVPSPLDMAAILKKSGARYDADFLNKVRNVNEYSSARQQALNLGIYGADLSYASVFNQNQESILYLSCTKKLADRLGLSKAFNDEVIERMEMNVDNRDSLLTIISDTYYNLDAYLKENDRDHISAMIIAAGWIEGLYLGTQIAKSSKSASPKLVERIAEQKISLNNLIALVMSYNDSGNLDFILDDLKKIEDAYASVSINESKNTVSEGTDGVTQIGGKTEVIISDEDLANLTNIVFDIRQGYVQL